MTLQLAACGMLHSVANWWSVIYIIKADMSVCLFRMAGQTAGPIETKLDTRTHVHPGSVSGKVNVKVIHVCVRDWQKYETPGKRHLSNAACTTSGRRRHAMPSERLRNAVELRKEARRRTRRAASGAAASRTPSGGWVIRASDEYLCTSGADHKHVVD